MTSIGETVQRVSTRFPIEGYMTSIKAGGSYSTVATTVLKYLEPGSSILDFGSGPCDKTAILQELGFKCSACDDLEEDWHKAPGQRERILGFVKETGIDFRAPDRAGIPFDKEQFDMVMLHDVLEHIHDTPRELLNDLLELTKPEGLLFITVPNQVNIKKRIEVLFGRTNLTAYETFYWSQIPWRGHVREYVRDDLVKLASYLGLDVLELRGVDHMLQKIPGSVRAPYLALTSIFDGWKDSWLMVARKPKGWAPRRTLTGKEAKAILPDLHW